MKKLLTLSLLLGLVFMQLPAQTNTPLRQNILFNTGWKFAKGNPWYAQEKGFDDSKWQNVQLPHDWAISGPFDPQASGETGKLPWKGEGWYRKSFKTDPSWTNKRVYVLFDGVMAFPQVYVNGRLAGSWDYGYNSFYLDITDFLTPNGDNLMAVYADTRAHDSRWYPGAGIYRKVSLIVTDPVHTDIWGTYITTPKVNTETATVRIQTTVENKGDHMEKVAVHQSILDDKGTVVAESIVDCPLKSAENHRFEQYMTILRPMLWHPDHPYLYTVKTVVSRNGTPCDEYQTPFGVRTMEFTTDNGFLLNGKRFQMKGVCLHHDLGALGAAFNYRAMQKRLEVLRDMGCNAIRTSHNVPAPELLDLCDQMGFLVFDELFDKWEAKADYLPGSDFAAFARRNADNFLRRDRNHPSVFIWSVGNEIGQAQANFEGGFEKLHTITDIFREIDPSRPITLVCDNTDAAAFRHMDYYDVLSYNYGRRYSLARKLAPDKAVIISESASTLSTRGYYDLKLPAKATEFSDGLQISSYDLNAPYWAEIPEEDFRWQEEDQFVAGEFVWTGYDYLGEPTPYGDDVVRSGKYKAEVTPRSSYFGIIDLAGIPKDRYYLYKSVWLPNIPTVHILPHWTWPGKEGKTVPVFVYTNGDCAELFLNGKSLGKRCKNPTAANTTERYRLMWPDVVYAPGTLRVVAYKNGQEIGSDEINTAGDPVRVRLSADRKVLKSDGEDLSFVTIEAFDSKNYFCPLADLNLQITVGGAATLAGVDNGDPLSLASFQGPSVKLFNGKAIVILRSKTGEKGPATLTVSGKGIKNTVVEIKVE